MSEYPSHDEFNTHAQRLLRYRFPLVVGLLINCALIARVPLGQMRAASSPRVTPSQTAAVEPTTPAAAGGEASDQPQSVQIEASEITEATSSPAIPELVNTAASGFGPPVATPELEITVPTPPANNVAEVERVGPLTGSPTALTVDMSQMDLSWASEGFARGLSGVRNFWQHSFDNAVQRDNIEMAAQTAEQPLVVEIPEADHAQAPQRESTSTARASRKLELENPVGSGGPVSFLIDGRSCTLLVGESHSFPSETPHSIQFHRGGEFGDDEVCLTGGRFEFRVTAEGWQLIPAK